MIVIFFNINPPLLQTTDSSAHVFLAEGVGGASITLDRGSAPRKGMERFLQPMGEGRAEPRRSGQWEARVPGTTVEPLRGAGLRDAPTHPPRPLVQSGDEWEGKKSLGPGKKSRVVVWSRVRQEECSAVIMVIGLVLVVVAFHLRSFAVAHRGGGDRAAGVVRPWISERGFESHRGG